MDEFKIKNFAASHPGQHLPIQQASSNEVSALRALLLQRLGLSGATDGLEIVESIASRSVPIEGEDATRSDFDLTRLLVGSVDSKLDEEVFLNWHRFDELDRMWAKQLAEVFDDVWYPFADDLDVVDAQCRWILSIAHHGGIRVLRLAA